LIIILVVAVFENITNPYMNYPSWIIIIGGVLPILLLFIISIILMKLKSREGVAA
jgi:hypothetical protein